MSDLDLTRWVAELHMKLEKFRGDEISVNKYYQRFEALATVLYVALARKTLNATKLYRNDNKHHAEDSPDPD